MKKNKSMMLGALITAGLLMSLPVQADEVKKVEEKKVEKLDSKDQEIKKEEKVAQENSADLKKEHKKIDSELKNQGVQGKKLKFMVNDLSMKNKKIVLSQKKISDKERDLKREILKGELKEGSYVTSKIKSIHNFGLIVDMNGIDALVPASEASFKKNIDLNKEFQIGATVRGKILSMDWKENKVSISLKDSSNDPWSTNVPFKEGDIVKATVESIKQFGVFVRLNDHFHALQTHLFRRLA